MTSATEVAIEVAGLRKTYGSLAAVDGVDLTVARGECVALLGPNGAGKTTTTEILEGYRHADAGTVRVLGEDPARGGRAWRARLGIVLQTSRDLGDLSVREIVTHFARYFPAPRDPEEVIAVTGLAEKADARAGRLSGGQRRRLDVALGIVGDPELLFLDEPTTGFDPAARREFWGLIETLKHNGTTILLTTHYLEEAERLADRVAVIAAGRIIAEGTPATLGGRDGAVATVRWTEGGVARSEETHAPTAFVASLAARLGGPDGEVPGLEVVRPDLEDVYLSLIAGLARDEAASSGGDPA
jgi:ABC-2 type transport system ATP-binding protein